MPPYIRYIALNDGKVYASVVEGKRTGKTTKQKYLYSLGRVIDQEKGIFRSREHGLCLFSLESGFTRIVSETPSAVAEDSENEKLILDFGDSFVLDRYFKTLPFYKAVHDLMESDGDTLLALLYYRILTDKKAYCYAATWFSGNFASLLCPRAKLQGQRISEFLVTLGGEEVQRSFFTEYLTAVYGRRGNTPSVLIDSTSLENASGMSITQLNNHNGEISVEIRLIYVIDRRNGLPIYFRYCPGNIIDVSTLCTTIAELAQYDVSIEYAIVDAGYFSEENVKELYRNKIHFVTRLPPNRKLFKQVEDSELSGLMASEYMVRYGNRLVYIRKKKVDVYGHTGYAYIGIDTDSRNQQYKKTAFAALDDKLSPVEADDRLDKLGVFMLLSSDDMDTKEVLPLYYTRQQIEQVFDIGKGSADLLPLRIQNENTFRGHLMLTFMATAILQRLQRDIITRRKKGDKTNPEGAFMYLRNQKCKVYRNNVIPQEAVKKVNEVYKLLGITCPTKIARDELLC
jgi:hypothetical protein